MTRSMSVCLGNGGLCPKCNQPMQRLGHGKGYQPRPGQMYYFSYWDKCGPCKHLQHYEAAKGWVGQQATPPAFPRPAPLGATEAAISSLRKEVEDLRRDLLSLRHELGLVVEREIPPWEDLPSGDHD